MTRHAPAAGFLETRGLLAAVTGLDCALKTAQVSLASFQYVSGGLVAFVVFGETAAVKAAIDAARTAASSVGTVTSHHVIPRPHDETGTLMGKIQKPGRRKGGTGICRREFPVFPSGAEAPAPATPQTAPSVRRQNPRRPAQGAPESSSASAYSREALLRRKTVELRSIARGIPGVAMTRAQIRDSRKDALVAAILEAVHTK